jgi:hypothetical protein
MSQPFWKLTVVLSLLLLGPRAALAEEAAPENGPSPRTELPASLHLLEDLAEPAVTEQAPSAETRVATVTLGALGMSALAGLGGYAITSGMCAGGGARSCGGEGFLGLAIGGFLGAPLGAWLGGMYAGGSGSLGAALGGAAAGGGISLFAVKLVGRYTQVESSALLIVPLSTLLGTVIFYERSHRANVASAAATAPAVQPLVSVSPRSAALGLGGRF